MDTMKAIYEYSHEQAGSALTVELQTNGFFSDSVAAWIAEHVDVLWVSCDGPPEVHDRQRPTANHRKTSWRVEKNLRFLNSIETMQVGVRVTLTSATMHRQRELVDYFHRLGIRFVNVLPVFAPVEGSGHDVFDWEPREFAAEFLAAHNRAKDLGIWYNSMCIANFDEHTRVACRSCTPCPHLTTDGYVSCCDFAQLGPEYTPGPLQQLVYGTYHPDTRTISYDERVVAGVRSRCVETLAKSTCAGCEFLTNCAGGCLGQVVNETGDLMGKIEDNCEIVRYLGTRIERNAGLHPAFHS